MPSMHELPFPVTVGGSKITKERLSGPPSKMYPVLRDLAVADAQITIEIDAPSSRHIGVITGLSQGRLNIQGPEAHLGVSLAAGIPLKRIIAFRVLKIEVEKLPARL